MIRLSDIMQTAPELNDFWALERCVTIAARARPALNEPAHNQIPHHDGGATGTGAQSSAAQPEPAFLNCDVVPEFRDTPRKWQLILITAFERGQRARAGSY